MSQEGLLPTVIQTHKTPITSSFSAGILAALKLRPSNTAEFSPVNMITKTKVPVTVLTGYLGSGKTTLLNRILTHEDRTKVAVIVNEFGEVGIDSKLVVHTEEQIVEMNNGCICCTVRGDLIRIIDELMEKRDKFDHLLIETTGLADPGPVIQSFFTDDRVRSLTQLDAIVTVVDAKHIWEHFDSSEAQEQIAFADVLLINKTDLVSADQLDALQMRVRSINALATIHRTQNCAVSLHSCFGHQSLRFATCIVD